MSLISLLINLINAFLLNKSVDFVKKKKEKNLLKLVFIKTKKCQNDE